MAEKAATKAQIVARQAHIKAAFELLSPELQTLWDRESSKRTLVGILGPWALGNSPMAHNPALRPVVFMLNTEIQAKNYEFGVHQQTRYGRYGSRDMRDVTMGFNVSGFEAEKFQEFSFRIDIELSSNWWTTKRNEVLLSVSPALIALGWLVL